MAVNLEDRARINAEMEYHALREEMLRRIDSRQQTLSITLPLAGAFMGLGWNSSAMAMMIYPPLALLLAAGWAQNEVRIRQINRYLRERLEPQIPGLGYQKFAKEEERGFGAWPIDILALGGIFLFTQILALGLSVFRGGWGGIELLMMGLDLAAIALVIMLVDYVRRQAN